MLNDDEATPTRMIGKKMAPILEHDGRYIPESMDIFGHIDKMSGDRVLDGPRNPQIVEWIKWISGVTGVLHTLTQPRWAASPLPEFATAEARAYFTRNKQAMFGSFEDLLAASASYIAEMDRHLLALNALIVSPDAVNGDLSEADIHLFSTLRALFIVSGITYPPLVEAYRNRMAQRSGVQLHDHLAI